MSWREKKEEAGEGRGGGPFDCRGRPMKQDTRDGDTP